VSIGGPAIRADCQPPALATEVKAGWTQVHRSGEGWRPRRFVHGHTVVSNQQSEGGATKYRIDIEALVDFVAQQVELVESVAVPEQFTDVAAALHREASSSDELRALWLSAGLATHVGLAIFREPERFITSTNPSPASPAALAA
jgi:hypothetical protein